MSVDFSMILVLATALCGAIWGLHAGSRRLRRGDGERTENRQHAAAGESFGEAMDGKAGTETGESADATDLSHPVVRYKEPVIVEYARSFFPVLLIVLIVRSFMYEPFRIPSSSMLPTLLVGDFIFVNKYIYGLRLPVLNWKFLEVEDPERGDVVVFKLPTDPGTNYIKRLVGLPGDTVTYRNRRLYINGEMLVTEEEGEYRDKSQRGSLLYNETLGDVEHNILLIPGQRSLEGTFVVPPGHYFFMGDNRDNSRDSRYRGVGIVPEDKIVGKAVRIWMNWGFPNAPRWNRIGRKID